MSYEQVVFTGILKTRYLTTSLLVHTMDFSCGFLLYFRVADAFQHTFQCHQRNANVVTAV
jgi:hypothetical protein